MGERKRKYSKGKMYFGRIALMFLKIRGRIRIRTI